MRFQRGTVGLQRSRRRHAMAANARGILQNRVLPVEYVCAKLCCGGLARAPAASCAPRVPGYASGTRDGPGGQRAPGTGPGAAVFSRRHLSPQREAQHEMGGIVLNTAAYIRADAAAPWG